MQSAVLKNESNAIAPIMHIMKIETKVVNLLV